MIALSDKSEELFDRLYHENHLKVYRLALGLAGNANDAEETTQEAHGQRVLFCLVVTLGLPYRTAAEIVGCSLGSVKTALHRAKKRVAGYLADYFYNNLRRNHPAAGQEEMTGK